MLQKPILLINYFDAEFPIVNDNVVKEIKNIDELKTVILDRSFLKIDSNVIQNYLQNKIYKFDGKCGERAARHILSLFNN